MEHTVPFMLQFDETLDIGSDTHRRWTTRDYQPPFAFTGRLDKITMTIDRPKLSPEDIKKLEAAAQEHAASK